MMAKEELSEWVWNIITVLVIVVLLPLIVVALIIYVAWELIERARRKIR